MNIPLQSLHTLLHRQGNLWYCTIKHEGKTPQYHFVMELTLLTIVNTPRGQWQIVFSVH